MLLTDHQLEVLKGRHRELADVVESDRAIKVMRTTNVIDLKTVQLRRERVKAAEARWGHQLRGDGTNHA